MGTSSEWTSPLLDARRIGASSLSRLGTQDEASVFVGKVEDPALVGTVKVVGVPLIRWFEKYQDALQSLSENLAELLKSTRSGNPAEAGEAPCVAIFLSHHGGYWALEQPQWQIHLAGGAGFGKTSLLRSLWPHQSQPAIFQAKRTPVCVVFDTAGLARGDSFALPFRVQQIALHASLHDVAHHWCGAHWRLEDSNVWAAWFRTAIRGSPASPRLRESAANSPSRPSGRQLFRPQALLSDPRSGRARLVDPVFQTLSTLDNLASQQEAFGPAAKALERLAISDPAVVKRLLSIAKRGENRARVRWFILETLARRTPSPQLIELLLEALQTWPEEDPFNPEEGMALLGAVVALRLVKVPGELREPVRTALIARLEPKRSQRSWRGQLVAVQTVGQLLAVLGSFASAAELEMFRDFWQGGHDFTITLNAIGAAKRTARRERRAPQTEAFFEKRSDELRDWLFSFARTRGTQREIASLFWAMVELISVRQSKEMRFLVPLRSEHPALQSQLLREVTKARTWLEQKDSAWLTSQAEGTEAFFALQDIER